MPKRVTSQEGNIELILADNASNIDLANDTSFTGVVNVGPYLDVDGTTGKIVIQDFDSLTYQQTTPGGDPVSDPQFGSVVFLASFENAAANALTYTPEIGGVTFEWLNHSGATEPTQVDGQIETAQSKFGTKSIYAKETAGVPSAGWQTTALTDATFLAFAGDFTLEMHVYIVDNTSEIPLMAFGDFGQYKWELTLEAGTGRLNFRTSSNGTVFSGPLSQEAWGGGSAGFTTGSWQHLAICRSGDNWYAWKDGVLMDGGLNTVAVTIQNSIQGYLCIMQEGQNDGAGTIECYIDNIRITDGVARYTTAFTPPTAPYEGSDTENVLLVGNTSHNRVDIADGVGLRLSDVAGTDYVDFSHDGTDLTIVGTNTTDLNFNGLTALNVNGAYLDIQEIADPVFGADAARGKLWVRNDTPNTLMFTNDAGVDFVLNSQSGTADGDMLYWDQTTSGSYLSTSNLQWLEASTELKFAGSGFIAATGTNDLDIQDASGTSRLLFTDADGGTGIFSLPQFRLASLGGSSGSADVRFFSSGGSRIVLKGEHANYLSIDNEGGSGSGTHAQFGFPIQIEAGTPTAASVTSLQLWAAANTFGSTGYAQNSDQYSVPLGAYETVDYEFNNPTAAADPGGAFFRVNSADFSTATELYFNDEDNSNQDQGAWFSKLSVGDLLRIQEGADPTRWLHAVVDSVTDNTGWWTIGITPSSHNGTVFINGQPCRISFERQSTNTITAGTTNNSLVRWDSSDGTWNETTDFAIHEGDQKLAILWASDAQIQWTTAPSNPAATVYSYIGFNTGQRFRIETTSDLGGADIGIYADGNLLGLFDPDGDTLIRGEVNGLRLTTGGTGDIRFQPGGADRGLFNSSGILTLTGNGTQSGVLNIKEGTGRFSMTAGDSALWVRDDDPNTLLWSNDTNDTVDWTLTNTISEIEYQYSSAVTSTDPGAGVLNFDSVTIGSITTLYIDDLANTGDDQAWWLSNLAVDDLLTIRGAADPADYIIAKVSSVTDSTGFWTIGLTLVDTGTIFTNNDPVRIGLERQSQALPPGGSLPAGNAGNDSLRWTGSAWAPTGRFQITSVGYQLANAANNQQMAVTVDGSQDITYTYASINDMNVGGGGMSGNFNLNSPLRFASNDSIYMGEKLNADADEANFGQIWVRNDTPNTLMFTDDTGVDTPVVVATGTPVDNQVAVWTDANTVEGDANFTWDATTATLTMRDSGGTDTVTLQHDGATFDITASDEAIRLYPDSTQLGLEVKVNASVDLYNNNVKKAATNINGFLIHRATNDSTGENNLKLAQADGTIWGEIGYGFTSAPHDESLDIVNKVNGGHVRLRADDTAGTERNILVADTDESTDIWGTGVEIKRYYGGSVTTTDATVTEAIAVDVSAINKVYGFEIHVVGNEAATSDAVYERIFGAVTNDGGAVGLIGSTIIDRTEEPNASAWVITVGADDTADTLTVDVTGEAAHTIDWKVRVELIEV